jgi:hypothetical protein
MEATCSSETSVDGIHGIISQKVEHFVNPEDASDHVLLVNVKICLRRETKKIGGLWH